MSQWSCGFENEYAWLNLKLLASKSFTSVATLHPKTHIHNLNSKNIANVDIFLGLQELLGDWAQY